MNANQNNSIDSSVALAQYNDHKNAAAIEKRAQSSKVCACHQYQTIVDCELYRSSRNS